MKNVKGTSLLASLLAQAAAARGDAAGVESAQSQANRLLRLPRYEPHQGVREMERRRRQRARAGLPIVEPAPIDAAARIGADEEVSG